MFNFINNNINILGILPSICLLLFPSKLRGIKWEILCEQVVISDIILVIYCDPLYRNK